MGYVAERTSPDVERLEAAGARVLGKTNIPEFGHKGVTDNPFVGATATPFDTEKNAGGSSGGSAAAVAAGMAPTAIGSDSGGPSGFPPRPVACSASNPRSDWYRSRADRTPSGWRPTTPSRDR